MKVELIDIKDIHPYEKNPRRNKKAIDYVANSLKEYGFKQPLVVDKEHKIIVGHTRYQAARQLKLSQVPVIVAEDLTDDQVRAYRIADNKTHEYSLWDEELLSTELEALLTNTDLSQVSYLTAFSESEIDRILNGEDLNDDPLESIKGNKNIVSPYRVGFLILANSYRNRGPGTGAAGWIEWGLRNGIIVDVISDGALDDFNHNQFRRYEESAKWITPDKAYNETDLGSASGEELHIEQKAGTKNKHILNEEELGDNNITLHEPIIRLQDAANLRSSLVKALSEHTYDALLCNTVDTLLAVVSMGIHTKFDNIFYLTRSEDDVGIGNNKFFTPFTHALIKSSGVKVICQTERMRRLFLESTGYDSNKVFFMPHHIGQPEFLEFNEPEDRKGVLYIGAYEPRKDPEVFINACKQTGLPAVVITPSIKSARKFKERFIAERIEHEIHIGLSGKNKVDVISRCAVAVIPSKQETFCFTAIEAAHCCPTIIPLERDWTESHKDWCIRTPLADIPTAVKQYYGKSITPQAKDILTKRFQDTDKQALELIAKHTTSGKVSNALSKYLDQHGETTIKAFFRSRPSIALDELFYVLTLQYHEDYEVEHTVNDTIIRLRNHINALN